MNITNIRWEWELLAHIKFIKVHEEVYSSLVCLKFIGKCLIHN